MNDDSTPFRMLADATYDWETWVDERGVTRWINPAVTRITGYDVDTCLAMPDYPLALAHPADRALLASVLDAAARGQSGNDVEFRIVHRRGDVHWVAVSFQGVRASDGCARGYRTSMREIDERKRMEEELHAIRRKAEALAQARSELLANVSHELRSPAHCIAGFAELLIEQPLAPTQRRYVDLISDQCRSMLRQVEDLLSLTALEAGGVELILLPVELTSLVGSLLEGADTTARARGLELSATYDLSSPWVEGDALRLKQILRNLVDNALKFTQAGAVRVHVRDAPQTPAHSVVFEVSDTGVGMPQADIAALLAPFRQGDSGSDRSHGGVGLGLAIVDRLVSAMGGTLAIESALGRGTTVRVSLPLAPVDKCDPAASLEAAPHEELQGTALVVDDSAPARELLSTLLALSGIDTLEAASEEQARTLAASRHIDVVFLDYQMPGSDGAQTAATLRRVLSARDPSRRVPIFILTANVFAREQLKEAAESVDDILTKPLSRAALSRLLRTVRRPVAARWELLDEAAVGDLQTVLDKDGVPMLARLWPKVARDMEQAFGALFEAERVGAHDHIARQAHVVAGHAALMGARVAAERARSLEDAAASRGTELATLRRLIAALHSSWAEARVELEALARAHTDRPGTT